MATANDQARLQAGGEALDAFEQQYERDVDQVEWYDEMARWYVERKAVHAGCTLMVRGWDEVLNIPTWLQVRIESENSGRQLWAYYDIAGLNFKLKVADADGVIHPLRQR